MITTPTPWLIRHGESEGNIGAITHSPSSIQLTEHGHQQASRLAATFTAAPDLIVVSPYLRTQQTAAPLRVRFPHVPVEEWFVQEFTYLDTRAHAGTTEKQRASFAQAYWQRCDPDWRDGEGAESYADFIQRIDLLEQRLHEHRARWVVVFTHGYFIKGVQHRRENPAAKVDASLMASFRDSRRLGLTANIGVLRLSPNWPPYPTP